MKEEQNRIKFNSPRDSGKYFLSLLGGMRDKERFMVAFLDNSNRIIETRIVSEGTIDAALVQPRNILKTAIANDCTGLVLSHNHPGASLEFSKEDKTITQRIVDIFQPLGIRVLDHIIVGGNQYASLAEKGCLPSMPLDKARYDHILLGDKKKEDVSICAIEKEALASEDDEELEL